MRNRLKWLTIFLTLFSSLLALAEEPVAIVQPIATVSFHRSRSEEQARVKKIILDLLGPEEPIELSSIELSSESPTTK